MLFENECRKYVFTKERAFVETLEKTNHGFTIEFDHISRKNKDKKIYLFDSKYYTKISELNYKQIAYHYFLVKTAEGEENKSENIVNGLILPTEREYSSRVHVDRRNLDGVYIQEHYVNIRDVMEKYIS